MRKEVFGVALIYLELILVIFPLNLKMYYSKYCCVFYGSPLWPLEGAMIQSLCVDWRKALRCVWSVNNRTHCDIITSLSNQFPLILRLKKRFIKLISNCLVSQNNIVKIISQVAICNPMSNTGSNYRGTLDSDASYLLNLI